MKWTLLLLLILLGCNSKEASLSAIQGIRDPNDPQPYITSVATPASGKYIAGDILSFDVYYSVPVSVSGSPVLSFMTNTGLVYAAYTAGSDTQVLNFTYTVPTGVYDLNGITLTGQIDLAGGSISDPADNNDPALLTYSLPDTTGVLIDTITPAIVQIVPPANRTYKEGQNLDFLVRYDYPVNVTSAILPIDVNGTSADASYVSGSGTRELLFRYTVPVGVIDTTGVDIVATSLLGSINDPFGDPASVSISPQYNNLVLIDSVKPSILNPITVPVDGTYSTGQYMEFTVNFSEPVTVSGVPLIQFTVDSGVALAASYVSGSGSSALLFRYVVLQGYEDPTGISVNTTLMNGSGIVDLAGNGLIGLSMSVPTTSNVKIDTVHPVVTQIVPPVNGTYRENDNLDFKVRYDSPVTVVGTPTLPLDISGAREASYVSGTGSSELIFRYTVPAGTTDTTGVDILASSLNVAGGNIYDSLGDPASITIPTQVNPSIVVDSVKPYMLSPIIAPSFVTYAANEYLEFTVNFSEAVTVSGLPSIDFQIDSGVTLSAIYVSGSGSTSLLFRYIVELGKEDPTGIVVNTTLMDAFTIADARGNQLASNIMTVPDTSTVKIDTVYPVITEIVPPTGGTYLENDTLNFIVRYDHAVTVVGTPILPLDINGPKEAAYISGSGTTDLLFSYTIPAGVSDLDGVDITASDLVLGSGTEINDVLGGPASLTLINQHNALVLVDSTNPTISSVNAPANGTYYTGESLEFVVYFSETVNVGSSPRIEFTIDSGATRTADYVGGTGSTSFIFRYTVQSGEEDLDGIIVSNSLVNGGGITDVAGNPLTDFTMTVPSTASVLIDGVAPTITMVSSANAAATYVLGDTLSYTMTFSEPVWITGSPKIKLDIGGTIAYATCMAVSGASSTSCYYTIASGLLDTNGVSVISPLNLNGSTIRDASTLNVLTDTTFSMPVNSGIWVDSTTPTILGMTEPAVGSYRPGDNIDFTVTFSEVVIVTGTPRIELLLDASILAYANYVAGSGTSTLTFRYTPITDDLCIAGLQYFSTAIALNGGAITDGHGNIAPQDLPTGDISKTFVIPTELTYWFDASDTLTVGTSGSFYLQEFKSKASALPSPAYIYLSPTLATSPTGSNLVQFYNADYVELPDLAGSTVNYILIVYKTSSSPSDEWLFYDYNNLYGYSFSSTGSIYMGANCTGCKLYSPNPAPGSWYTINASGYFTSHVWSANEYRTALISMNEANTWISLGDSLYDGQIAEVMLFTATTINPQTLVNIGNYLNTKHGASW